MGAVVSVSHSLCFSIALDCISLKRLGSVLGQGECRGAEEHTCGWEMAALGTPHNDVCYGSLLHFGIYTSWGLAEIGPGGSALPWWGGGEA